MKGIVLERLDDKLIVLTTDGGFIEIDKLNDSVDIGEEIVINTSTGNKKQIFRRLIAAAAVFLIFFIGNYGVYSYYTPQGYVNVDINPSIEIAYNVYGKPIKLRGLNEDGNRVIEKVDKFYLKSIDITIDEIIKVSREEGFISKEKENIILITVTELNKNIDDQSLKNAVDTYIKESKIKAKTVLLKGNKTIYEKAKNQGISPCKLILVDQAIEKSSEHKFNDINKKSVKEIMDIINKEEEGNKSSDLKKEKVDKEMFNNSKDKIKPNTEEKIRIEKEEDKSVNTQDVKKEKEAPKETAKEYKKQQEEIYSNKHKEDKEENKKQHKEQDKK